MPPRRPTSISLDIESQRKLAVELFNYVWTLLENEHRTAAETDLMVAAAYASRFFWEQPGGPVEHVRSQWQISRVCATAGLSARPFVEEARAVAEQVPDREDRELVEQDLATLSV